MEVIPPEKTEASSSVPYEENSQNNYSPTLSPQTSSTKWPVWAKKIGHLSPF
jgi:hypothetical protein